MRSFTPNPTSTSRVSMAHGLRGGDPVIDGGALIEEAERGTGLSDWGDDQWRVPYETLISAMNEESELSPCGVERAKLLLVDILSGRLKINEDRKRFPAIAEVQIDPPILIVGCPRAGSTYFHNLLAQDPEHLSPKLWEIWFPSPPPGDSIDGVAKDPRVDLCNQRFGAYGLMSPEIQRTHRLDAEMAEECVFMWIYTFQAFFFQTLWDVPDYIAKVVARTDYRYIFSEQRKFLQHLQFGKTRGNRWLLKDILTNYCLGEFESVFPDAKYVWMHRDPAKVVASLAKLHHAHHLAFSEKPTNFGREALQFIATILNSAAEFRAAPGNDHRFFDAYYTDLRVKPIETARNMYKHFAIPLSAERKEVMENWLVSDSEKHKRTGTHEYTLEEVGLNYHIIDEVFAEYIDRFNVPLER